MSSVPQEGSRERIAAALAFGLDTLLHSYSAVLFARSRTVGLLLLLATFVVPDVGLVGLLGVGLASGLALAFQLDRSAVRSGLLGYNALLVFLGIGALLDRSAPFYMLAFGAALLTVVVHVGLGGLLRHHLRLPALSLPFVVVSWVLFAAVPYLKGVAFVPHPPAVGLSALPGPAVVDTFLRSLGAIFFQPHWLAGALVLAAVLLWSRIAVLHAVVGFAVAWAADTWLLAFPPDLFHLYAGFNITLTAVALGGVFYVPGRASLLLAVAGAFTCALVTVGSLAFLGPHGLPVLAMPLNIVVLMFVYAMRQRRRGVVPVAVDVLGGTPEQNIAWYRQTALRFDRYGEVRLALPFRGAWVVTQGNDGPYTHMGAWRHGLDFEVCGSDGQLYSGDGAELTDYHCYRLPVTAPCAATVVQVVDGVPDNPPGTMDTLRSWGNVVVLRVSVDRYVLLAHLSPGSLRVRVGDVVVAGQELGRCGASGRAPRPHLHVQLQARPEIGAPTVPLAFCDVWVEQADGPEVAEVWIPQHADVVRNVVPSVASAAWARMPVGARQEWVMERQGEPSHPFTLVAQLDDTGCQVLHIEGSTARLRYETRGTSLYMYGVDGEGRALRALYAALLKVPLDSALDRLHASVAWTDHLDPRTLRPSRVPWLHDVLECVVPMRPLPVRFTAQRRPDALWVEGSADGLSTRASIGPDGLIEVVVEDRGRRTRLRAQGAWA